MNLKKKNVSYVNKLKDNPKKFDMELNVLEQNQLEVL